MLQSFGTEPVKAAILDERDDRSAAFFAALGEGAGVIVPQLSRDTADGLVAELDAQLCLRAKEPLTLIGFGFGAWMALLYAVRHADMVRQQVLVGCPPLEQMSVPDPPASELCALRDARTAWRSDGTLTALIQKPACPIYVLHGEYDSLPVDGVTKPLAREFAAFETVILYGCGHEPHQQENAIKPLCELLWSIIYEQRA